MSFARIGSRSESRRVPAVGRPDAASEREADRIADETTGSRRPSRNASKSRGSSAALEGISEPPGVQDLLPTPGSPLDPAARAVLEPRFQFDFSHVRVHHDSAADRAASGLDAHAFTLGRHIAFSQGEYAPETPEGLRLLSHELAHVVQHTRDPQPIVRRDSKLKGKANQQFGEGDASDIDKAIAASPVAKYIDKKKLKTLKGNVDMQSPVVFEKQFEKIQASGENVDEVPGFVNREEKEPIKLRLPGKSSQGHLVVAANFETAVHETIHLNSSTQFQQDFGHNYNEGVTEHFTEMVLGGPGKAYREHLHLADGLISLFNEDMVAKAYFQGDRQIHDAVMLAFNRNNQSRLDYVAWQHAREKKPPDWATANRLLTNAVNATRQPGAAPSPPVGRDVPAPPPN
jgi:hypothetical protein